MKSKIAALLVCGAFFLVISLNSKPLLQDVIEEHNTAAAAAAANGGLVKLETPETPLAGPDMFADNSVREMTFEDLLAQGTGDMAVEDTPTTNRGGRPTTFVNLEGFEGVLLRRVSTETTTYYFWPEGNAYEAYGHVLQTFGGLSSFNTAVFYAADGSLTDIAPGTWEEIGAGDVLYNSGVVSLGGKELAISVALHGEQVAAVQQYAKVAELVIETKCVVIELAH